MNGIQNENVRLHEKHYRLKEPQYKLSMQFKIKVPITYLFLLHLYFNF